MSTFIQVITECKQKNFIEDDNYINLEDFEDKEEFLKTCHIFHDDVENPIFKFTDYQDLPESLITDTEIDEQVWEWIALGEDKREIVKFIMDQEGLELLDAVEFYDNNYVGCYPGDSFNENAALEKYALESINNGSFDCTIPNNLLPFFDIQKLAKSLTVDYLVLENRYIFRK